MDVYASDNTDLIVDINGYFAPDWLPRRDDRKRRTGGNKNHPAQYPAQAVRCNASLSLRHSFSPFILKFASCRMKVRRFEARGQQRSHALLRIDPHKRCAISS